MKPERWEQINELFQSAADRAPEERAAFLKGACGSDERLRREVESLLAYYDRAENFIETPAFAAAPDLQTQDAARALIGELFGHYRIESLIGVGGMGELYLARDERLGRKVALKFLPERLTADKMQLSRFKSEARAASALNHPNILTVYEIGEEGDRHFIATEFIEGVTLRASLGGGRMTVHDALEVAMQVASALAAAHEAGVVHRDIKPENIMLRRDGYVKLLDFGIAKLTERQWTSNDRNVRMTTLVQTQRGLLMGTVRYMSPEQMRGQPADARSDIWSLGVVLYEMVAGTPPFSGATASDCIASILTTEPPPLSSISPDVPIELQSIVRSALRKNRDERYQTISEMLADLRDLKAKLELEASAPKVKSSATIAPHLHELGEIELKHGAKLGVVNLYNEELGNSQVPERLRLLGREEKTPRLRAELRLGKGRWTLVAAAVVIIGVLAIGGIFWSRQSASTSAARGAANIPAMPEKSIAVLPFENLSEEKANAFFADGVQDEILTDLSRIADLKVISRISVMAYKSGVARNLREIGKQLGVANVVEGSVQRSGNRVRVNAQLVDARTDRHLWAQTYDRDLADVFAIQSEIAKTIADQLQAKLSPREKNAIERPPTSDISAFDLYTRGKNLLLRAGSIAANERTDALQAIDLLNQAVARDPSFFDAYCQLAWAHDGFYILGYDHSSARLALADAAVEAASRLRPDAGETHLARGQNLYQGYLNYDSALAEVELARQILPNDPRVFLWKGLIKRRQGRWEESIRNLERGIELDPRNFFVLEQTAQSYQVLRRYTEEKSTYDRLLAFEPNDAITNVARALVELNSKADTQSLHQRIAAIRAGNPAAAPTIADAWLFCALAERDTAAAENALVASGENPLNLGSNNNVRFNRLFFEGVIARMINNEDKAQSAFTAARAEQEKIVQAQPNYGPALCVLALIDAGIGRKQEALREGRRAAALLPSEKDALDGSAIIKYLAMIAAWAGDKDLACEQLAIAIRIPSGLSYGQLKLLPFWDPLRGDPRFEKLVEEAKQPVALK